MQTITFRDARVFSETDTEKGWSEAPPDESASGCGCFIRRLFRFVMQLLLSFQFPFVSDAKIKAQYIQLYPHTFTAISGSTNGQNGMQSFEKLATPLLLP